MIVTLSAKARLLDSPIAVADVICHRWKEYWKFMIRSSSSSSRSYKFLLRARRATTFTCSVPIEPAASPTVSLDSHYSYCLSLTEDLLRRGLLSSAKQVIRRLIKQSPSISDAFFAVKFASLRGIDVDSVICGALIRKMVFSGQHELAETYYHESIFGKDMDCDLEILNLLVIALCKLRKFDDAVSNFNRIVSIGSFPSKEACNALVRELCADGKLAEGYQWFLRIFDANVNLGVCSYNLLIYEFCDKGYMDEAVQLLDVMCERTGLQPTLHLYKSLFYGFCKWGLAFEAEFLFEEMESCGFFVDKTMYTSLMKAYCKDRKMKMAMRIYFRMLKMGCTPDTYTHNTLLHGFVKMGLFDEGWVLFNYMSDSGWQHNVLTYHIMISNYCREGKADCGLMLLNNMISGNLTPSLHSYTVLMAAFSKEKRIREVDQLYKTMLECGVVPDHALFFVLLKNCSKGHELDLALTIIRAIANDGCGLDLSTLSLDPTISLEQQIELLLGEIIRNNLNLATVAFSIYISALCEGQDPYIALDCLDKMISLGCSPLIFTFNSLVKCLFQRGLFEDAFYLMEAHGKVPDQATYLIMVKELCDRGNLVLAFDILDNMKERGLKPSVAIYDCIISCLSREGRSCEAESTFLRMVQSGVDPDGIVYTTMISAYSKAGRAMEARDLFEKMREDAIQPSSYSYTSLISGLMKRNMIDKGNIYLDRMLEDGFVPNKVLYTALIGHCFRKRDFKFAFRLYDLMNRNHIEEDLILNIAVVSGICRNIKQKTFMVGRGSERDRRMLLHLLRQVTLVPNNNLRLSVDSPEGIEIVALNIMHRVKKTSYMPNIFLYNCIISGFCRADSMQDAYDNFESMEKEGICPNAVTFTILMRGHIRAGEIDHAISLFNKMNSSYCFSDRVAYDVLLKGLCYADRLLDALSLFYTMHKRGYYPTKSSYRTLLDSFRYHEESAPAFTLFEEMTARKYFPPQLSCNWLLCILCEEQKFHQAFLVCVMMIKRGKFPGEQLMKLLIGTSNYPTQSDLISVEMN